MKKFIQTNRTLAGGVLLAGCALSAVVAGRGVTGRQSGFVAGAAVAGAAEAPKSPVATAAEAARRDGYRASQFPHVMVIDAPRESRAQANRKSRESSIYRKPGAKRPALPHRVGTLEPIRIEKGRSSAGGRALYLGKSRMPYERARLSPKGRAQMACEQDGSNHADHKQHVHSHQPGAH